MRMVSVVGARPQFVKLAPVATAFERKGLDHLIIHTGQHYDFLLSQVFFSQLGIPEPAVHLGVGSGTHGQQTGAMLAAVENDLVSRRPDCVVVYGDTNTTLAGALAAAKLHIPVAHVEAGLRSFNRRMPEEHNRVVTDHLADILLAPTEVALENLRREGLGARGVLVGDVMADVLYQVRDQLPVHASPVPPRLAGGEYLVATIHRAENTDERDRLASVVRALAGLPFPVLLLAHPRLVRRAAEHGVELCVGAIEPLEPLPFVETIATVAGSRGVVTDSGGLQKEAFLLGVPCTTLRCETEWVETLEGGWNVLAGDLTGLPALVLREPPLPHSRTPYGEGRAAEAVAEVIMARLSGLPATPVP